MSLNETHPINSLLFAFSLLLEQFQPNIVSNIS